MARRYAEVDGKPQVVETGHVNLGIAVDVQRKDGSRSSMVPCIKAAETLDFAAFHASYEDLITKSRENKLTAVDFQGTNITLTNPGGPRHRRVRAPAYARPGDDRSARGSLAYLVEAGARARGQDQGAGDLEGDDHHLDVRPPDHPGRRVGPLPAPDRRATCRARTVLYEWDVPRR